MNLLPIKIGDTFICKRRGALRFTKLDEIKIVDIVKGYAVPDGMPHVRLAITDGLWRKQ